MPAVTLVAWLAWLAPTAPGAIAAPSPSVPETPISDEKSLVEDEEEVRLSLPTEADWEAWRQPGLRIALGYSYSRLNGNLTGMNAAANNVSLRPSVRLDEHWSLGATFTYASLQREMSGMRFSVTIEPSFHPWEGLTMSVGAGYAGLVEVYRTVDWNQSYLVQGPDGILVPQAKPTPTRSRSVLGQEHLEQCSGAGWNLLGRIGYLFVVGPRFASGPFVETHQQWVLCEEGVGETNNETGRPVVIREWWRQRGVNVGWWLSWR